MKRIATFFLLFFSLQAFSQELNDLITPITDTNMDLPGDLFRGSRLGNGHTTRLSHDGELTMIVSHRFGEIKGGMYELFGLDQATMRIGFEYGFSDRFNLGFGRSTYQKTYDLFAKYKLFRSTGQKPIESAVAGGFSIPTIKNLFPTGNNNVNDRSSYWGQLLLAVPLPSFSLQAMPTFLRSNYLPQTGKANNVFSLGAGASARLSKMVSLNVEYYYHISNTYPDASNPLTFGVDIETGGHLFQLIVSNTQTMFEKGFLSDNHGHWGDGNIYFGFNLIRVFYLK
ncbi:MAG: DUF5777 family beta-barrel protein [Prolixibacteraceae bacterium]|jgi:hypothetical protein|nr:DUF5777 family beta-barrel protein [Prolixibacteraceae bacterium]